MKPSNLELRADELNFPKTRLNGSSVSYRNSRSRVGPNSIPTSWPVGSSRIGWGPENSFIDHSSVNYDLDHVAINDRKLPAYVLPAEKQHHFPIVSQDKNYLSQLQNGHDTKLPENSTLSSGKPNFSSTTTMEQKERVSDEQVYSSMISLAAVGFPASIMTILALQLMLHLEFYNRGSSEGSQQVYGVLFDVAISLSALSFTFSITAMFVSFLQLFLCLKAVKMVPDSKIRTMKYLRQGMCLRFLAFVGFFLSIPVFLLAMMISMHVLEMYGSNVTAAAFTVIGIIGLLICTATLGHAIYSWLMGHFCLSVEENTLKNKGGKGEKNLSTLV